MANIPGAGIPGGGWWNIPATEHIFEKPGGKLTTDDWDNKFEVEGNIRLIGLAVLEYALSFKNMGASGIRFSRFDFDFSDGIKVKPARVGSDPEKIKAVTDIITEIEKIIDLKAFW